MQAPRKWSRPALPAEATAGEVFVANMRAALEQIAANATGAAAGRDPEYLHQLRVGVRRLRAALRAYRELLRRRRADAIEQPWRAMMQTLGNARDWDLFHRTLEAGELQLEAGKRRAETQRLARALVKSPRFREARRRTFAWAQRRPWRRHADPAEPLRQFARPALQRLHQGLCKAAHGIDWRDAARRHRVRIRVKRMRYGCDFFATAFPHRRTHAFLEGLHTLQDILGEMNDIEVQRELLRRIVLRGIPPNVVEAESSVRARLASRERELIAALDPAWAAFESRRPFWRRREAARARG
jgi:CHAD domain-containing protein